DRAAELLDSCNHPGDRLAEDQLHLLGVEALRERSRADDVRVERGHRLALLSHRLRFIEEFRHAPLIVAWSGGRTAARVLGYVRSGLGAGGCRARRFAVR